MRPFEKEIAPGEPSIRLGYTLPPNTVNLGFVHGPDLISEDVVEIYDYSLEELQNMAPIDKIQTDLYVGSDRALYDINSRSKAVIDIENILLTGLYKNVDGKYEPLFYTYQPRFYHYEKQPPVSGGYYIGQNIKILRGQDPVDEPYLIKLTQTSTPNVWTVTVYSQFTSSKERHYTIFYSKCKADGSSVKHGFTEIYNSVPLYTKTSKSAVSSAQDGSFLYSVTRSTNSMDYNVYVPKNTTTVDRNPVLLRWRIVDANGVTSVWKCDYLYNINSMLQEEIDGVTYMQDGDAAVKILSTDIRQLVSSALVFPVSVQYQVWSGSAWTYTTDQIHVELLGTQLRAWTTRDTGSLPSGNGIITNTSKRSKAYITVNAYLDPPDTTYTPESWINHAKVSSGATASVLMNTGHYPIYNSPSNIIDGCISAVQADDAHWYALSAEVQTAPTSTAQLTVTFPSATTLDNIEIVAGNKGQITKIEYVYQGQPTTLLEEPDISINTTSLSALVLVGLSAYKNLKVVRVPLSSPITCDSLRITMRPTSWIVRDYHWLINFLFGWLGFYDTYQSGFELIEVNALEKIEATSEEHNWSITRTFGVDTLKNNPTIIDIRNLLEDLGMMPPGSITSSNVKYKFTIHDETPDPSISIAIKDTHKFVEAKIDNECSLTYNDIMAKRYTLVVTSEEETSLFSHRFTIKNDGCGDIVVLPFENMNKDSCWFPRINNGRMTRKHTITGDIYDYYLPEFASQPFTPTEPYMAVVGEKARHINSVTVKVSNTPLHVTCDSNGEPTNLSVYELVGQNKVYHDVDSWNIYTGEIILKSKRITTTDQLYCDYSYVCDYLIYKGYGDPIEERFYALDLNPLPGHTYTDSDGNDRPSKELMNKTVYLYLVPAFIMDRDTGEIHGNTTYAVKHIIVDRGTDEAIVRSLVAEEAREHMFISNPDATPQIALLARIELKVGAIPSSIEAIDSRRRGGGFLDTLGLSKIKSLHKEAQNTWDVGLWDGTPYSANGVIEITLPKAILSKFTDEQIRDIINRYVAYGVYTFVQYKD